MRHVNGNEIYTRFRKNGTSIIYPIHAFTFKNLFHRKNIDTNLEYFINSLIIMYYNETIIVNYFFSEEKFKKKKETDLKIVKFLM